MKQLALLARFAHFSGVLAGVASVALCFQTALLLDWIFIPGWFYLFIFCITFLHYGTRGLYRNRNGHDAESTFDLSPKQRHYFILFLVFALLGSAYLVLKLTWLQAGCLLLMGMLSMTSRTLSQDSPGQIKYHGFLKMLSPVLVWSIGITVITATFIPYGFDNKFWWLAAFRFFYMLALFLSFNGNNNKSRTENGRKIIYERNVTRLSYAALVLAGVSLFPAVLAGMNFRNVIALLISLVITFWMVRYPCNHKYSPNYYLLPEFSMILQTLLICIAVPIP